MSRRLPDVVFLRTSDPQTIRMECDHCKAELGIALPASIAELVSTTDAFIRRHRPCQRAVADARKATS